MLVDAEPLPGYQEPYGLLCAILQDGTNEWRWELDQNLAIARTVEERVNALVKDASATALDEPLRPKPIS